MELQQTDLQTILNMQEQLDEYRTFMAQLHFMLRDSEVLIPLCFPTPTCKHVWEFTEQYVKNSEKPN